MESDGRDSRGDAIVAVDNEDGGDYLRCIVRAAMRGGGERCDCRVCLASRARQGWSEIRRWSRCGRRGDARAVCGHGFRAWQLSALDCAVAFLSATCMRVRPSSSYRVLTSCRSIQEDAGRLGVALGRMAQWRRAVVLVAGERGREVEVGFVRSGRGREGGPSSAWSEESGP